MSRRAVQALALAIALAAATSGARANDNDAIYKAIQDFCIKSHASIDAVARLALKAPFQPREFGSDKGPPYSRQIGLVKLGTIVTFTGPARNRPPSECLFVSYSDDLAALLARMKTEFALSQPVENTFVYNGWQSSGSIATAGRAMKVKLDYSLQDNQKAGSFNLTIAR